MTKKQNYIIGAAVAAASLVGTLTTLLLPRRRPKTWTEQAQAAADRILETRERIKSNMVLGGITGGLVGVTTALLLAPKSGKELIKDLAEPFQHKKNVVKKAKKVRTATKRKSAAKKKSVKHEKKSEAVSAPS